MLRREAAFVCGCEVLLRKIRWILGLVFVILDA
jgi:hypothetical protein